MTEGDSILSHAAELRDINPSADETVTLPAIKSFSLQRNNFGELAESEGLSEISEEGVSSIIKAQSEEIEELRTTVDRLREEKEENSRENTSIYDKEF